MAEEKPEVSKEPQEELFEIEVIDDTPEEDRPFSEKGASDDDDEMRGIGQRAQDRIGQLKREFHDKRREAEAAQRMQTEAISVAQTVRQENEQLKALLKSGNSALFDVTKAKNDADLSQAQSDLTKAYDEGNAEEIVSAQTQLNELMFDGRKLQEAISQREFLAQTPAPAAALPQKPDITLTERDTDWIRRNPWFQKDQKLTAYAMGLHYELTQQEGVHPNGPEYYKKIDEEMRKHFPIDEINNNYQNGSTESSVSSGVRESTDSESISVEVESEETVAPVVAPATRSSNKKPTRAKLTKTQVDLARKLGITNEQYAKQLLKEQANG
jgi:regulator of replication initiation timing|tara:strand:+ start:6048 stop:7028 length:981 start_codon:yes stop_codon:yes gene_type:complete